MLANIAAQAGLRRDQICMVGDRLDTDIQFGLDGGLITMLVLSGGRPTHHHVIVSEGACPGTSLPPLLPPGPHPPALSPKIMLVLRGAALSGITVAVIDLGDLASAPLAAGCCCCCWLRARRGLPRLLNSVT